MKNVSLVDAIITLLLYIHTDNHEAEQDSLNW